MPATSALHDGSELWVFGYGSLIWNPEFPVAEQVRARADGWKRSFCMWSLHYRGTPERPGLVLALDAAAGEVCEGVALRVMPGAEAETLAALRARELVSHAYHERRLQLVLADGRFCEALSYVIDHSHAQYAGSLALDRQAEVIAQACGGRGTNGAYLRATVDHLRVLGIFDPELEEIDRLVRSYPAGRLE